MQGGGIEQCKDDDAEKSLLYIWCVWVLTVGRDGQYTSIEGMRLNLNNMQSYVTL